jgi:pyruvate formate lyase activating enzyme
MRFAGLQKSSLIDYPNAICAVLYTQGCNFRCPYCHNPELVENNPAAECYDELYVLNFMNSRVGKLDAVTITGGEPTLHKDLPEFIEKIKSMGFLVKLDTNGTNPGMLEKLVETIDYVAMDIKAPLKKYKQVVRAPVDIKAIKRSIMIIKESKVDYEFRSTIVESQLTVDDILEMGSLLKKAKRYFLQSFVPNRTLDKAFGYAHTYPQDTLKYLAGIIQQSISECRIR